MHPHSPVRVQGLGTIVTDHRELDISDGRRVVQEVNECAIAGGDGVIDISTMEGTIVFQVLLQLGM